MPQISLYIDEQTFQKVQRAAAGEQKSLSRWVVERIKTNVDPVYPPGFEKLFGSVKEPLLKRPEELLFENEAPRNML